MLCSTAAGDAPAEMHIMLCDTRMAGVSLPQLSITDIGEYHYLSSSMMFLS